MNESRLKILIVDDNKTDLMIIKEAIANTHCGATTFTVSSGEEAMEFLRRVGKHADAPHPDLVLLDINMPRKNGLEVLDEIKNDRLLVRIPVVILTTSGSESEIAKAYAAHANCYIRKPIDFESFEKMMDCVVRFWFDTVTLAPPAPV